MQHLTTMMHDMTSNIQDYASWRIFLTHDIVLLDSMKNGVKHEHMCLLQKPSEAQL